MSVCPNCNHTNQANATHCSECKQQLASGGDIFATIDHAATTQSDGPNRLTLPLEVGSLDNSMDFEADGLSADDPAKKTITTIDLTQSPLVTNSGTVVARDKGEIERTLAASDADANDISSTQISPLIDVTIDRTLSAQSGPLPLDATIYLSDEPVDSLTDAQATILFDTDGPRNLRNDQTIIFGSEGTDHVTNHPGGSGTQGRLKRMWEGAVGSSANPMHSLSAISLQASDSIFERVATRKVLDANAPLTPDADYKIINKLGEGAMGIVFTARQTTVDRLVALKTAKPKFQKNEDARRRFLYEAQITADLDHSNIVPIHELGSSEEGMLFYSMKIVEGDQWSRVITEKTREQNLDIFMKVADAVAFAHSKGIIHRDLKPENTMLGLFGEVFVTDWGTAINLKKDSSPVISSATAEDRRLVIENTEHFRSGDSVLIVNDDEVFERNEIGGTNGNELLLRKKLSRNYKPSPGLRVVKAINMAGTPCYMAPEMAGHQLHRLGRCSDIYVLGGILYDMITGRPPHSGPTVTHCLKHALDNQVKPPESVVDDALLKIALKAMSTNTKDRYQSVGDMQDAVRQYRRHAESISLGNRSTVLLQNARATSDYETFSRAMFGFRDAIEMWSENTAAKSGLETARREYGEAAYKKGDYDLVLQTVDRSYEHENALYEQAVQAKQRRIDRESRLKKLQKAVAVIVIGSVAGLSALSYFLLQSKNLADTNARAAHDNELKAEASANEARTAQKEAEESEERATASAKLAQVAQKTAEDEKMAADDARKAAEQSADNERIAKEQEKKANEKAQEEKGIAVLARMDADTQRDLAQKRSIDIQLDEYKSSLPLALSQLKSFDVRAARENLIRLQSISNNFTMGAQPAFDTWGWQRINLLSNSDLPRTESKSEYAASAGSAQGNAFALATKDGHIAVYAVNGAQIRKFKEFVQPVAQDFSVAMSSDGKQLAFAYSGTTTAGIKYWSLNSPSPIDISSAAGHRVQCLAFTPDGDTLVAGINAGVWVWKSNEGAISANEAARKIEKVRGNLVALQGISPTQFLMTIDFQNKREIRLLDIISGSNKEIEMPEVLQGVVSRVLLLQDAHQMVVALNDNRLAICEFLIDSTSLTNIRYLENRHNAAVTSLTEDISGRLISSSNAEPVAQVWHQVQGQWLHLCSLSGLPDNLQNALALNRDECVGLGQSGDALLWNIDRQLQRNRMQRISVEGQQERYAAPVQRIALGRYDQSALTIDANGVVDCWSLLDGSSEDMDGSRYSYIGHTPGAELVDTAVSDRSNAVVTSARLQNSQRQYLSDPKATWEFCLWDTNSSTMIRRWTGTDGGEGGQATVEPRLSLVDQGQKLLVASDRHTRIIDLWTGNDSVVKEDFGTYFAVPCPARDSLLLLVKRTGAIRFLDLNDVRAWDGQQIEDEPLRTAGDTPLKAVWTSDGNRIYIAYASGNIAQLSYNDGKIKIDWNSNASGDSSDRNSLQRSLASINGRATSYFDFDLAVTTTSTGDVLQYAIRSANNQDQTKYVKIQFPINAKPILVASQLSDGLKWLKQESKGSFALVTNLDDDFEIDVQRVKAWHRTGQKTFVSNRTTQTYVMTDGQRYIDQFGRAPLQSAVGDSTGRTIYALLTDGAIWKFSLSKDNKPLWTKLHIQTSSPKSISLSSDGRFLTSTSSGGIDVWDLSAQTKVQQLRNAVCLAWDSTPQQSMAASFTDGSIRLYDHNWNVTKTFQDHLSPNQAFVDIQFFRETWADAKQEPRRHVMVHTRDGAKDIVAFFPTDSAPESSSSSISTSTVSANLPLDCKIVASPREGVFVVGTGNGTVSIWFCMPSWGAPRQLYELEGHRGAAITTMSFTTDGKTLVTADNKNRLYAWLSQDPRANQPHTTAQPLPNFPVEH